MVTTIIYPQEKSADITNIAFSLIDYLSNEKKLDVKAKLTATGFSITAGLKGNWKIILGLPLPFISVDLTKNDDKITVIIGSGNWKVFFICLVILGMVLLGVGFGWVILLLAAMGAWRQRQLLKHVCAFMDNNRNNASSLTTEQIKKYISLFIPTEIFKLAGRCEQSTKELSFELYKLAAEQRIEAACVKLGSFYYAGEVVEKDLQKAFDYWSRYPEKLDSDSALKLADMYRDGKVTKKDLQKAFELYQKVPKKLASNRILEICEQGTELDDFIKYAVSVYVERFDAGEKQLLDKILELYARLNDEKNLEKYQLIKARNGDIDLALELGKKFFEEGKKEAVELLEIANVKNDPVALRMLGEAYWVGKLVPEDNKKAIEWFRKAVEKGSLCAAEMLVGHYGEEEKDEIKLLKALEQEIALAESGKYVDKRDEFVLSDELYELAWLYCSGGDEGKISRDVPKGIELFEKAIDLGDTDSYLALAEIYSEEEYKTVDYDRAVYYCRKAVEANVDEAEDWLEDVLKEQKEASQQEELKKLLVNYKNDSTGETSLTLAKIYEEGNGIQKDDSKALSFYQDAAEKGNAEAVYHLGCIAENGIGMECGDIQQALELYELSGNLGYEPAFESLALLKDQLNKCRRSIISFFSGKRGDAILGGLNSEKKMAIAKYFAPVSFLMAGTYSGMLTEGKEHYSFAKKYRTSTDPRELSLAFLDALENACDEEVWDYFEWLFTHGVYWPCMFFSHKLWDMVEKSDDNELADFFATYISGCAMEGCLEAQGICAKLLDINFDDTNPKNYNKKEWEQRRPNIVAKLKEIFVVFPTNQL